MIEQESIQYSVLAGVTGIIVVFCFLIFLSILMMLLRRFSGGAVEAAKPVATQTTTTTRGSQEHSVPSWVSAAIGIYLLKKHELEEA